MNNQYVKKILNFLTSHPTLESVNNAILEVEIEAMARIEDVEAYANLQRVNISISKRDVIARHIDNATGISYLYPSYGYEFKKYTAMCSGWHILFHAVRESICDYYSYLSGEISKDETQIKMTKIHLFSDEDRSTLLCKEFQNGKAIYWYTKELAERVAIIRQIAQYFSERGM